MTPRPALRTALRAALVLAIALPTTFSTLAQEADPAEETSAAQAEEAPAKKGTSARQARRQARRDAEKLAAAARQEAARQRASTGGAVPASRTTSRDEDVSRSEVAQMLAAGEDTAPIKMSRRLERAQEQVLASEIGQDPTVQTYLQRIASGHATPQQIGAVANFISDAGLLDDALTYYETAIAADRRDPLLWLNYGIVLRRNHEVKGAASAFSRALNLAPNNAAAHYNLGAMYDEQGKYDDAVEEYKLALSLDPTLGDPRINPQAANNDRLIAVKLLLYRERDGGLVLPLQELPKGGLASTDK